MKKVAIQSITLLTLFLFTACGGGTTSSSTNSKVTVQTQKSLLTQDQSKLSIDFLLQSDYASGITSELSGLNVSVTPCSIKNVSLTPETITFSQENTQKSVNALVEFDEACTPTAYQLSAMNKLELDGKTNKVSYSSGEISITPTTEPNDNSDNPDTTLSKNYEFYNIPDSITISDIETLYEFKVQLINAHDTSVVTNQEIKALAFDINYGELLSMSSLTDSNGFANFSFKSPKSLEEINGQRLYLTLINEESAAPAIIEFTFDSNSTIPTVNSDYKLLNASSLTVTHAETEQTITVDLVNNYGIGVANKSISITTISSQYGFFNSSTASTNTAGRANFIYKAPDNIDAIDGESTTAILSFTEGEKTVSQEISIAFAKSTDNTTGDTTLPTVVIPSNLRDITLTNNSKSIEIPVQVYKDITPYTEGNVHVELPAKVLNGIDVGSFSTFSVPVDDQGIATFNYTSPSNLKALLDNNDTGSTFKFYHSENSATENRQIMEVSYSISADTYIPIDYSLHVSTQENDFSMGIPELQKTFSVVLKDTDGNIINDSDVNITNIRVTSENGLIAQLFDTDTKTLVNTLSINNENSSSFILKSKKLSGIAPLNINIEFTDINGEAQSLSTIVNVRVMSGPPSAISISYVSSSQDAQRAKYEETFAVSVTDEYGNRVNTQPNISLGAIVGYAVDGSSASATENHTTKRLFYGKEDIEGNMADGVIDPIEPEESAIANTTYFEDATPERADVFKYLQGNNSDKLVIFGAGKNYEAMGKWDFTKIDDNTLALEDDYFGAYRSGLYYAIGHNYYQDPCLEDGREWIGSTDSETYQLDDEGTAIITYKYDYHLTGKDALIWVNLNGYQADTGKNTRIGEVLKHTLRGTGLIKLPSSGYSLPAKSKYQTASFQIWHEDSPERYRNAHFGWRVKEGSSCAMNSYTSSNQYDARTCSNGGSSVGSSYVNVIISTQEDNASCSFDIELMGVAREF